MRLTARATALQDDYYVFLVSDANLSMYGVSPNSLAKALLSDPMVTQQLNRRRPLLVQQL